MTISFNPVSKDEKHILQNLYSLYLHDLSEFTEGLDISTVLLVLQYAEMWFFNFKT